MVHLISRNRRTRVPRAGLGCRSHDAVDLVRLIVLALLFAVGGCGSDDGTPAVTATPTTTATPTAVATISTPLPSAVRTEPTPEQTPVQTPVCTPPLCAEGEVFHCEGECPGGCGTQCATPTPAVVCTPPLCAEGEVFHCEGECPGGCGTTCATLTATPTPTPTPTATPDPGCAPDDILLEPSMGRPGEEVRLTGTCDFLHSGQSAEVYFDTTLIGEVMGDTAGRYELLFNIPADAEPGSHEVDVVGAQSAIFDVQPAVVCTPPPCAEGEVFHCDGACPGGCGTECATPTPAEGLLTNP